MTDQPILVPNFVGAAIIGNQEDGYSLRCSRCQNLLMQSLSEGQVLGIDIFCPVCHHINPSPKRQPGTPIPTVYVLFPPGKYLITKSVTAERSVQLAGEGVLKEYRTEVGYRWQDGESEALSSELLEKHIQRCVQFMGEAVFRRLVKTKNKSSLSTTPKSKLNRLIDVIEYARCQVAEMRDRGSERIDSLDVDKISELLAVSTMLERWKHHPAWSDLCKTLADVDNVYHTLIQLIVASSLVDSGNGISLVFGTLKNKRVADIYVRPKFDDKLYVEVKSPIVLHGPLAESLSDETAKKAVTKALEAASTRRGQIDPTDSAVIVLGGTHIDSVSMARLERQATAITQRQAQQSRKKHLAAIVIVSSSYQLTRTGQFTSTAEIKVIAYPGYKGSLELKT